MEGDNSDSSSDSTLDSVSSPEPVPSTSAASRAPAPITPRNLLPPSAADAATMNEVPLVPPPQQSTSSSKSKSETSKELLKFIPFTPGELIVKPKQMKCPRKFVPDAKKDEEYYEKRLKNSEAVRKWRAKKEKQQIRMKVRLAYLESEATTMKAHLAYLESEEKRMKALIRQYETERRMLLAQFEVLLQRVKDMEEAYQKQMAENQNRKSPAP